MVFPLPMESTLDCGVHLELVRHQLNVLVLSRTLGEFKPIDQAHSLELCKKERLLLSWE
jgi:hypothetical protein